MAVAFGVTAALAVILSRSAPVSASLTSDNTSGRTSPGRGSWRRRAATSSTGSWA